MTATDTVDTMAAEVITPTAESPLTGKDRCDKGSCGAQAYVRVTLPDGKGELLFCGHHYHVVEWDIAGLGATIFDQRGELDPKPYVPED